MSRGFTIAEVIVVIAIVGITAAAVVPALARLTTEDDLTGAARQLEALFVSARTRAVERAAAVTVTLVPATGRFWLAAADGTPLDSGALELPAGVRLESPALRPTVRFDALGIADGDSLSLVADIGARALTLDRWTGGLSEPAR